MKHFYSRYPLLFFALTRHASVSLLFFLVLSLCGTYLLPLQAQNTQSITYKIAPEFSEIKERGYITVAMVKEDQPPFFFTNIAGEFTGLDVEIAQGIAVALGVELRFNREAIAFNDLIPIVASRKANFAISKLSRTIARNQVVLFSNPYIVFKQALMFNRVRLARIANSNPEVALFIKRYTGTLGVIANSSYVNYAKANFPNATIVEFSSWEDVVNATYNGEVLAAYRDELEIKKITKLRSDTSLIFKTVLLSDVEDSIAIAISWEDRHLLEWMNLYLTSLTKLDANALLKRYEASLVSASLK